MQASHKGWATSNFGAGASRVEQEALIRRSDKMSPSWRTETNGSRHGQSRA
jgi:hypothetical protein